MLEKMGGLDYTEISLQADGKPTDAGDLKRSLEALSEGNPTDLFVFAHGWNNDRTMARNLYAQFFGQLSALLAERGWTDQTGAIRVLGVIWPSRRWSDEEAPINVGGAAGLTEPPSDDQLVEELKATFTATEQREALDRMRELLTTRPESEEELRSFHQLMRTLVTSPDAQEAEEDQGETKGLLEEEPTTVYERFADYEQAGPAGGGAAGLGDVFGRLWNGAKGVLRQVTYYEMKRRAGVVGKEGLAPFLKELHDRAPNVRVHLVGHSFGARLVSFALAGLPEAIASREESPVKSVTLIQGAFSHFSFAPKLPYDESRGGALAGMEARVDGPLVVTHTRADTALGDLFPLASFFGGQDASASDDLFFRWGAMGHDGAQASGEEGKTLEGAGAEYGFQKGKIYNLDSNQVIVSGGPPSGAHSDIVHPEVVWAMLSAANVSKLA